MLTSYANADLIRSMEPDVFKVGDTTNFPDATLRLWARDYADPEIDARLLAAGFAVPFDISTFTDLASATPYTTITSVLGGFASTDADLILVILSGTGFTADEYRIASVTNTGTIVVTSACATGAASVGVGWVANAPDLIRRISAMLAAAHGLDASASGHTSRVIGRADQLRTQAREMLEKIASGRLELSGHPTGTYAGSIVVEQDPETRPDTQVFVGEPSSWSIPAETREG